MQMIFLHKIIPSNSLNRIEKYIDKSCKRNLQAKLVILNQLQQYFSTNKVYIIRIMTDMIKVRGLKGKQNKKKWNKNIDVSGLIQHIADQHTQAISEKYATPLLVETQTDNIRKPLDPHRFKSKGVKLPKIKYDNRIKKHSLIDELEDPWLQKKQIVSKYKAPQIPAIIKPSTGHSYNPNQQGIKQIIDNVIDYEAQKPKKTKQIKKKQFKQQQVRIRNKNLRAQQLAVRQRRAKRQLLHELQSHKKIVKEIQNKAQQIANNIQQREQKQMKLDKQAKTGKVRYGKNLGRFQYRYRESIPNGDQIGKKLSHVSVSDDLIKDRFDSIYRRGIFQPRNIKVHANKTKKIKVKTRYQQEEQKQTKNSVNFIK